MAGEQEQQVLARIDAALARIEAAAARPQASAAGSSSTDDSALRTQVTDALRDLDRLIGALES